MEKQKRIFEVTVIQLWVASLIMLLVMVIVFEIGIKLGKKQILKAQFRTSQQNSMQRSIGTMEAAGTRLTEQVRIEKRKLQYTVQVGSFGSQQNAAAQIGSLESRGYASWLEAGPFPDTDKTVHRVLTGRFDTRAAAELFGEALQAELSGIVGYKVREIGE